MTHMHMKKCIENVKNEPFGPDYLYIDHFCGKKHLTESAHNKKFATVS